MATLTLKNVPEDLIRWLKAEALQNRRGLNQEVLVRLKHSVVVRPRNGEQTLGELRKLHQRMVAQPRLTDEFLERAKGAGRP